MVTRTASRDRSRSRGPPEKEWDFEEDGFTILRGILDPRKDLDPILKAYEKRLDALLSRLVAEGQMKDSYQDLQFGQRVAKLYSVTGANYVQEFNISFPVKGGLAKDTPVMTDACIFHLLRHPAVLDAVEKVLGGEIMSNPIQHARVKPPERSITGAHGQGLIRGIPWHQDQAAVTPDADNSSMCTVWIPITDCEKHHGCMVLIPGSHKKHGLLPHCPGMSVPDKECPDAEKGVPLPMRQGDILVMHKLTLHSSLANVSEDFCRVSVDLRFNAAGSPSGRAALPSFVARSRSNPESELTDPADYAKLWAEARDALASSSPEDVHLQNRWDSGAHQPLEWQAMAC